MPRRPLVVRLAYQLVPAALVAAVGVYALSNLTRTSEPATSAAPVQTAITADAVFTATPRENTEPSAVKPAARPAVAAKPVTVASTAPLPPRKPVVTASAPPPLPAQQVVELPIAPAPPPPDTSMIGQAWSATTSMAQMPVSAVHAVTRSVTGWFQAAAPPRPPATVPQNFQAEM